MSEPRCDKSSGLMRVAVALQGGGSHGAFTWGVRRGGRSEARAALASYWDGVGGLPGYASFEALPFPGALLSWHVDNNPVFLWMDMLARI